MREEKELSKLYKVPELSEKELQQIAGGYASVCYSCFYYNAWKRKCDLPYSCKYQIYLE